MSKWSLKIVYREFYSPHNFFGTLLFYLRYFAILVSRLQFPWQKRTWRKPVGWSEWAAKWQWWGNCFPDFYPTHYSSATIMIVSDRSSLRRSMISNYTTIVRREHGRRTTPKIWNEHSFSNQHVYVCWNDACQNLCIFIRVRGKTGYELN